MTEYKRGRGPHFAAIPWRLQDDERATAFHIATYAALKRFADFGSGDGARPSDDTAARLAGCSRRKLIDARNDLREWGWIEWESGAIGGTTNAYVIHSALEETVVEGVHDVPRGCAPGAQGGVHVVPTTNSPLPRALTENPPVGPQGGPLLLVPDDDDRTPETWMNAIWEAELGNGRPIALTDERRKKYRAMFAEQLKGTPDPSLAWRLVLRAVKRSTHHMSRRAWQMPESLLRNASRRDSWVQETVDLIEATERKTQASADFAAAYRARRAGGAR